MSEPVDVRPIRPFTREQVLEAWRANPRPNASACARAWGVPRTTARRWLAQWQKNQGALATAVPPADIVMTSCRKIGHILAALVIGLVGVGLAAIGMTATITYSVGTAAEATVACSSRQARGPRPLPQCSAIACASSSMLWRNIFA